EVPSKWVKASPACSSARSAPAWYDRRRPPPASNSARRGPSAVGDAASEGLVCGTSGVPIEVLEDEREHVAIRVLADHAVHVAVARDLMADRRRRARLRCEKITSDLGASRQHALVVRPMQ